MILTAAALVTAGKDHQAEAPPSASRVGISGADRHADMAIRNPAFASIRLKGPATTQP